MLTIEVGQLFKDHHKHLELKEIAGASGLRKAIKIPRIQKPGLALVGDTSKINPFRLQVFGKSELGYLHSLDPKKAAEIIQNFCSVDLACIVVTRDLPPPPSLVDACEKKGIPLFVSSLITASFITRVTKCLESYLTETATIHGVMMDIFGVGVLMIGKSGIGKSECALDLVTRGHRLVADDVVLVKKNLPVKLYASSDKLLKHHIEIRGLGILNARELFGITSIRDEKLLQIVVELVEWNPDYEYDRLGIDEYKYNILDIPLPYLKVPVSPGRNITTIIEVAARNSLLKAKGHFSSRIFEERLNQEILSKDEPSREES